MRLGLTLSGGGTRGMVHVGVLQALEDNGIIPDVLSGTSAGAIVGALYAYGLAPKEIYEMTLDSSLIRVLNFNIPSKGFVKHTYLKKQLKKYIPEDSFEALKKPLYIAIANLNTGSVEYKSKGALHEVVIASSTVPVLFEPVEINGHFFVDGGILKNTPVSILKDKVDHVIAVNLIPRMTYSSDDFKGISDVATRVFNISALDNIEPELELADVVIEPQAIESFSRYRFKQLEKMYQIGYDEAVAQMKHIKALKN